MALARALRSASRASSSIRGLRARGARAGLLALLVLGLAAGAVSAQEEGFARPWDIDTGALEAPGKIAFFRDLTRWNEAPSANQLAMDALAYDLTLLVDPASETISGRLIARLRVDAAQATVVDLDLAPPLSVQAATSGGLPAVWSHSNERLAITLDRAYSQGETVEVSVDYRGTPSSTYGAFGFDQHGGDPMIWTLSEPFGARSWWPCDDWSDDKADSIDLHISVPSGLVVASNGRLTGVDHGATLDTYHWHEGYPIATYLVSLAIHPYTVYSDYYVYSPTDSMEVRFFIFPDDYLDTLDENLMTVDMIAHFASLYGEYPFLEEKYGHAQFLWGGAMEHQTCTSTGVFYESIIAHELSHQWWGDMVTCADFHHIWLNEGFARYSEALWYEHQYGPEGYWGAMNNTRYYGGGTIYCPTLDDWDRIFSTSLTYNKASWVVHMLRHVLGDEDFFATLAAYRAAFEYGAAVTEDLQAVAEAVSGQNLSDFFQQWIYGEYYPQYSYAWESMPYRDGYQLQLVIRQTQTTGLFHMPIDIVVGTEGGGTATFVVDNAEAEQVYIFELLAPPVSVALDPEGWILKQVQEEVTNPAFDQGILLVNGVSWDAYGTEITSAYEDRAFWGDLPISFWDCFEEPAGGYPSTLPAPLGHGRVPSSVLGGFSTVIWVGNNYDGDLTCWMETAILSYLQAGGNVLLMTRYGDSFLGSALRDYLGIAFTTSTTINSCTAVHELLTDIARIASQSTSPLFSTTLLQETSELLYIDTSYNPDRGVGVLRAPAEGGTHNPNGGRFAFLSGRPYRWSHADLSANVETIVGTLFGQGAAAPDPDGVPWRDLGLSAATPALGGASLRLALPATSPVKLGIYDCQGRLVRTLLDRELEAGTHALAWDGRDRRGAPQPAGLYYVKLQAGESGRTAPLLLLR